MAESNYYNCCIGGSYDRRKKKENTLLYVRQMLNRTQSMFKWFGLPESIPEDIFELYLQTGGCCFIAKENNNLYAFRGGLGGEPDEYYRPTIFTVANPFLKINKNYKINEDGVLVKNDSLLIGLLPVNFRYATMLAENDITLNMKAITDRVPWHIVAGDDNAKESARLYLKKIEDGELGIIADNALLDAIKVIASGGTAAAEQITNLIEYQQYLKASWFNELGIQANYNMKRESINSNEAQLNDDALLPLVDNMLKCRKDAAEAINKMFDTDINVELNSSWKDQQAINDKEVNGNADPEGDNSNEKNIPNVDD